MSNSPITVLFFTITVFIIANSNTRAQQDVPTSGITGGIHYADYFYAEAGYSVGSKILWPKSSLIKGFGAFTFGAEAGMPGRFIIAPKITFSVNMFISFGASILYYTDFNLGALRFRPEVGVSMLGIRCVYGRNLTVANYDFPDLNINNFSVTAYIPLFDGK